MSGSSNAIGQLVSLGAQGYNEWMRAAGFTEADCAFKQWRFAVYFGTRP
jgi:hypothetical protein